MIRYGYKGTKRKDVLYTVRHGENIYFGVSRCNTKDKFDKELGVEIAAGRARTALKIHTENVDATPDEVMKDMVDEIPTVVFYGTNKFHNTKGWCKITDVKFLLKYFDNLNIRQRS